MPSTQKPNSCAELKQTFDQLLSEKQKFDTLMTEINTLRPNFSKNISDIKSKILDMQNIRTGIEDKIFEILYNSENNSDNARTAIKKYGSKIFGRIEKKIVNQQELNTTEVILLYDVKDKIVPVLSEEQQQKIKKIRDKRVHKADAPIVFACQPNEIAWDEKEVNQNTKDYIGPLFPGIFTKLSHLEHIYTAFPENKISQYGLKIGGLNTEELQQKLKSANIYITNTANELNELLESDDFERSQQKINELEIKDIQLVRLTVKDLDLPNGATTKQIYQKAEELGLYLCPTEVGPHLRLQYSGKEWMTVSMKRIYDSKGHPLVFDLCSSDERLLLSACEAKTDDRWILDHPWVFSLRKLDSYIL